MSEKGMKTTNSSLNVVLGTEQTKWKCWNDVQVLSLSNHFFYFMCRWRVPVELYSFSWWSTRNSNSVLRQGRNLTSRMKSSRWRSSWEPEIRNFKSNLSSLACSERTTEVRLTTQICEGERISVEMRLRFIFGVAV